jgi:hypothetical protein
MRPPEGVTTVRDWRRQIADSKARFVSDTDKHVMTVLHDDGLYRHLRFKAPDTGFYWFDLVTWPGHLSITGDMGALTFARLADMFAFFRQGADINPGYWGEKVVAGEVRAYSEDAFREWVADNVTRGKESKPDLEWKRIDYYVELEVLDESCYRDGAVAAVSEWNDGGNADMLGFAFNTDDADFTDFTNRFLWCCHAIRWGIEQYDTQKGSGR